MQGVKVRFIFIGDGNCDMEYNTCECSHDGGHL